MKLNVKCINRIILFSFVFLFIILQNFYFLSNVTLTNKTFAANKILTFGKNSNSPTITFDLEEEKISEKTNFKLKNVQIEGFQNIQSVNISLPEGIHFAQSVDESKNEIWDNHPEGWQTQSTDDNLTRNYLLTSNKTAEIVKNYLENLIFAVDDEKQVFQGKIEVMISDEEIAARLASRPGEDGKVHYYKFVSHPTGLTWLQAYNKAKSTTFKGLTGYLATIITQEEQDFIFKSIAHEPGWLGGIRMTFKDGTKIHDNNESLPLGEDDENFHLNYSIDGDEWYWACGSDTGKIFTWGKNFCQEDFNYHPNGIYSHWAEGRQPDNNWHYDPEYCLQFAFKEQNYPEEKRSDRWNDLPHWNVELEYPGWVHGYYVEFSEYGDQYEIQENSEKTASYFIEIKYDKIFSVSYDSNGGSGQVPVDDKFYAAGETVSVKFDNIPIKDGHEFLGWSINEKDLFPMYSLDESEENIQFIIPQKDVILYAVWEKLEESLPEYESEESLIEEESEEIFSEYESEKTLNPITGFRKQPVVWIVSIMAASLYIMFIIFKKREIGFWH